MLIPLSTENPSEVTFHGIKKIVLPDEKYQNIAFFPPVQNHCSVFAEGSILQHLEPDSVGAKFHGTVPLPSVNYWIISHHKTNYSL